jgi:hypothetical protein
MKKIILLLILFLLPIVSALEVNVTTNIDNTDYFYVTQNVVIDSFYTNIVQCELYLYDLTNDNYEIFFRSLHNDGFNNYLYSNNKLNDGSYYYLTYCTSGELGEDLYYSEKYFNVSYGVVSYE